MGGEGSMASAIVSLKNNRSLVRNRKYKKAKGLLLSKSKKTKTEFKKISSKELEKIKFQIRSDAKKRVIKNVILNIFLLIIISALGYLTIKALDGH